MEVELIDQWQKVTAELLRRDGYIVGWTATPLKVGETMPATPGAEMGQPFYVVGEATRQDAERQFSFMCRALN